MSKVGGLSHINYKETRGLKVSGGSKVKAGTILTREGDKWKPGINVGGRIHLTAVCDGEVYFTQKKGHYKKRVTIVNVKPLAVGISKKPVKKTTKE
jgi:ribosomal protein L27